MRLWTIGSNSLRRMVRDPTNIFFVFVLPIVLILVIGLVFGGAFESRVGVVSGDSGPLGEALADGIAALDGLDVTSYETEAAVRDAVRHNELEAGIVIPPGYDASLRAGDVVELVYVSSPSSGGFEVQSLIDAAVADQAAEVRAAGFAAEVTGSDFDDALATAATIRSQSPAAGVVVEGETGAGVGRFDLGASSNLVLFLFLTAVASSVALIQTRRLGVAHRMYSTPTTAATIVGGETLGRFLVVMVQGLFIVIVAAVVFGVDWGNPWGASLIVFTFALAATGAGMLVGSTFSNEQQAGGIGIFLSLMLAALGGAMVPLEIFPETMRRIAHLTPHAWALDGFAELIRFQGTAADVIVEAGVLLVFAAVMLALASWRLRRALTRR